MGTIRKALTLACVFGLVAGLGTARAADREHRRFTLVLPFNTCAGDPENPNVIVCDVYTPGGQRIGAITVTFQSAIMTTATAMSWHERWDYRLLDGSITVASSTDWQTMGDATDESGFAPTVGFGRGAITHGSGEFSRRSGSITMRWDDAVCICLVEIH